MKNCSILKFTIGLAALFLVGCSSPESADNGISSGNDEEFAEGPNVTGEDVFTKRIPGANTFTCSTCHTVDTLGSAFRTVGHDITNSAFRSSYKNGAITNLREAVNNCVEHWMTGDPWEENNNLWQALDGWLQNMDTTDTSNLTYNIVTPPGTLSGGNLTAGMVTFNQTCAACHGTDGVGTSRGPSLAGSTLSAFAIANRVRTSGPTNTGVYPGLTGGRMPFWAEDRLSDPELRDIIAFIDATVPITPGGGGAGGVTDLSLPSGRPAGSCGSDHPAVGSTSTLSTFSHQVAGTVRVIDNCTLEISNFSFDGGGIDIRLYTGVNRNFFSGTTISQDLFGRSFSGDTVRVRLPSFISLDDFNSLSVWCVPVGADFGNAAW